MITDKLFDLLDDWRRLPAYQLERRADIFFALHMEEIIRARFQMDISLLIPEFPVRVGSISRKNPELNKSFKIDYLAYSANAQRVLLIELKTDQNSLREKQDWYLESAAKLNVSGLIDGLLAIYKATLQKAKYDILIGKLEAVNWVKRTGTSIENQYCVIVPEVVYIQPVNLFEKSNVICFDQIIDSLNGIQEPLTQRFMKSLERWKANADSLNPHI